MITMNITFLFVKNEKKLLLFCMLGGVSRSMRLGELGLEITHDPCFYIKIITSMFNI